MQLFHKILLCLGIVMSLLVGVNGLLDPTTTVTDLNILIDNATARNEMRAVYGGFPLVTALFLLLSLVGKLPKSIGFAVMFAHIGGIFLGRLFSLGLEGVDIFADYSDFLKQLYVIDCVMTVLFGLAFWQSLRDERKG